MDFLQYTIIEVKQKIGIYLYNYKSPLEFQLDEEINIIQTKIK